MKCPICGKQTLPGAKLCAPCRSALKRARDDSVWEMPGQPSTPGVSEPAVAPPSRWVLGSSRLAGWRGVTFGALAVVLVVSAGTLITRSGEAARAPDERPMAPAAISAGPVVAQPAPPPEKPAVEPPPELVPHEEIVQPPRHQPPPRPKAPRAEPEPVPLPAPAVEPTPRVEPPRAAPAPVREASRPADPWQRMSDALTRCATKDLFDRIGCEYHVRASFCDGHWGEVPQCPGAPVNDHGQ